MLTLTAIHAFLLSMMALHETVCVYVHVCYYVVARATLWPPHAHTHWCFVFRSDLTYSAPAGDVMWLAVALMTSSTIRSPEGQVLVHDSVLRCLIGRCHCSWSLTEWLSMSLMSDGRVPVVRQEVREDTAHQDEKDAVGPHYGITGSRRPVPATICVLLALAR